MNSTHRNLPEKPKISELLILSKIGDFPWTYKGGTLRKFKKTTPSIVMKFVIFRHYKGLFKGSNYSQSFELSDSFKINAFYASKSIN